MVDTEWGNVILDQRSRGVWDLHSWSDCWGTDRDCEEGDTSFVDHLQVNATTVVNFHGMRGYLPYVYLYIRDIDFFDDNILILNMNSDIGAFEFKASSGAIEKMKRIVLSVNGELRKSYWLESNGWYRLDKSKTSDLWPGLPEASTYGAAFSFSALAVGFIRKRKRRKPLSLIPSGVRV